MLIPDFVNFGAWFKPTKIQGKKVGVIYSAEHLLSTMSVDIAISSKAGACAQGIENSLDI